MADPLIQDPAVTISVLREQLEEAREERDEALAELARLRKIFDDAGQGEHNVLALIDHYQECAAESDERAALAYSRALQAAAGVPWGKDPYWREAGEFACTLMDECVTEILALTPEDIERITQEHEHG